MNPGIADAYKSYLKSEDWHYTYDAENGCFRFEINLHGKLKILQYIVFVKEDHCNVYVVSPVSADAKDKKQIREMAEFVCRANYGINDGNFELDVNDGELRYKSYVNCEESLPGEARVRRSIYVPAAMFNKYSNGILQVVINDMPAEDAINMCEGRRPAAEVFDNDDDEDEKDEAEVDEDDFFAAAADDDDEAEELTDEESAKAAFMELMKHLRARLEAGEDILDVEDDSE